MESLYRFFRLLPRGFLFLFIVSGAAGGELLPTNMDLLVKTLEQAVEGGLAEMDTPVEIPRGALLVEPQTQHAANWLVDHILAERLLARGFAVRLDSAAGPQDGMRLSYRILDLGITGQSGLLGGQIARQSRATLSFSLSQGDSLRWQAKFPARQQDQIPKDRADLLENDAYSFAKTDLETQTWSQFVEPVIVSTVLGGLIYLFFSNR